MESLLSVITSEHNCSSYLDESLESALGQPPEICELIAIIAGERMAHEMRKRA